MASRKSKYYDEEDFEDEWSDEEEYWDDEEKPEVRPFAPAHARCLPLHAAVLYNAFATVSWCRLHASLHQAPMLSLVLSLRPPRSPRRRHPSPRHPRQRPRRPQPQQVPLRWRGR